MDRGVGMDHRLREKSVRRGDEGKDCCSLVLRRRQCFSPLFFRASCCVEKEHARARARQKEGECLLTINE